MTELPFEHWLRAGLCVVPALLWAILAERTWYFVRTRRPRSWVFRMLPLVTGLVALHLAVNTLLWLVPPGAAPRPPAVVALYVLSDLSVIWSVALFRHLLQFIPLRPERPSRAWLAGNYTPAAALTAMTLFLPLVVPGSTLERQLFVFITALQLYLVTMFGLIVWQLARMARRGLWRPGSLAEVHRPDAVLLIGTLLVAGAFLVTLVTGGRLPPPSTGVVLFHAVAYLAMAVPLAVRMLGEVVRAFVMTTVTCVLTGAVYFGARAAGSHLAVELRPILDAAAVASLVALLLPGQAWLRAGIDRAIFRRTRRRHDALAAFLHTLSPELGSVECCRRAMAEFARVMRLRGAAILLGAEDEPIAHGRLQLEPLRGLWPPEAAAADRLFPWGFGTLEMLELPAALRDAFAEAQVIGVFPVVSRHRRWGHLFMTTGLLGMVITDEDAQVIRAFTDQLALVLDTADLLARAVEVERSLAHAEKLAAIGETAARIAHEIRNPVTAARSLAQQLARDPTAPVNAEHAHLILAELERVERQVAALLRFARREDFRFEPVDLGELVRATLAQFGPRLEAAGIEVGLELPSGVTPLADREKLRQVLVNLIENALDALASVPRRRLVLAVGTDDGSATLSVRDSGPGVPAEALPRLFEPFFSLKDGGTGLGLAIAKRTVEAHGGRIEAGSGLDAGMSFRVALPLAAAGHSSPSHGRSGSAATGGRTS